MLDKEVTLAFLAEYEALARKYQRVIEAWTISNSSGIAWKPETPLFVGSTKYTPNYISTHLGQLRGTLE